MAEITVKKEKPGQFTVSVKDRVASKHSVRLSDEYHQKLSGGAETPEQLIHRSFEFLLQREPNTSILSSFDLPLIQHYFPEYERSITRT